MPHDELDQFAAEAIGLVHVTELHNEMGLGYLVRWRDRHKRLHTLSELEVELAKTTELVGKLANELQATSLSTTTVDSVPYKKRKREDELEEQLANLAQITKRLKQ